MIRELDNLQNKMKAYAYSSSKKKAKCNYEKEEEKLYNSYVKQTKTCLKWNQWWGLEKKSI